MISRHDTDMLQGWRKRAGVPLSSLRCCFWQLTRGSERFNQNAAAVVRHHSSVCLGLRQVSPQTHATYIPTRARSLRGSTGRAPLCASLSAPPKPSWHTALQHCNTSNEHRRTPRMKPWPPSSPPAGVAAADASAAPACPPARAVRGEDRPLMRSGTSCGSMLEALPPCCTSRECQGRQDRHRHDPDATGQPWVPAVS